MLVDADHGVVEHRHAVDQDVDQGAESGRGDLLLLEDLGHRGLRLGDERLSRGLGVLVALRPLGRRHQLLDRLDGLVDHVQPHRRGRDDDLAHLVGVGHADPEGELAVGRHRHADDVLSRDLAVVGDLVEVGEGLLELLHAPVAGGVGELTVGQHGDLRGLQGLTVGLAGLVGHGVVGLVVRVHMSSVPEGHDSRKKSRITLHTQDDGCRKAL